MAGSGWLAFVAVLSGCAVDVRPDAPDVQLVTWPGQPMLVGYASGAEVWSPLGFDVTQDSEQLECPRRWYADPRVTDCVITIGVKREPMLIERMGTSAYANRDERYIVIDERLAGYDLIVAVAHEIGHVVLDSPEHTRGGVMGGSSAKLEAVDYDLACRAIGLCVK